MTGHANDTLSRYLEQSARDLARSSDPLAAGSEGLLLLGAWHQSYPAILVRDPFLSDSAKLQFLYLMQESCQQPRNAIAMPSLEHTAGVLGHTRKTVNRDRTLLRVCRWISRHKLVRDDKGRFCGTVNAIHSEPCSLADATQLDAHYMRLLESSRTHEDRYIANAAHAALGGISQTIEAGDDPMAPPNPMARRIDAAQALESGGGSFFDLLMGPGHTVASHASQSEQEKFTHGEADPWVNFGAEPAGHTVASPENQVNFTHGSPRVNFTHGDRDPWVNFTNGGQDTENKDDQENCPQEVNFTHGPTCSSSKPTTTNKPEDSPRAGALTREAPPAGHSVASGGPDSSLAWPDACPENERAMIAEAFAKRQLAGEDQQNVLDALARKIQDPDHPVRSPVGYAVALCKRVQSGTFQPVGPPGKTARPDHSDPARSQRCEQNELRQQIHELQAEVRGLDNNLIPYATADNRAALEAQRQHRQGELETLEKRYCELQGEGDPQPRPQS